MSKAQYAQRHDGRVAALQYLYAWSINPPDEPGRRPEGIF